MLKLRFAIGIGLRFRFVLIDLGLWLDLVKEGGILRSKNHTIQVLCLCQRLSLAESRASTGLNLRLRAELARGCRVRLKQVESGLRLGLRLGLGLGLGGITY